MSDELPLSGHHVLDLTRNLAGPYAAMILAELGADVVKVESRDGGDDTRQWGPPFWEGESAVFLAVNRNKRSIVLDLRTAKARPALTALTRRADVLLESFRPGALDRLGYGWEWASAINPGLIYCSVTPFGDSGPLRDEPGYDPMMQAAGGIMSVTGADEAVRLGISAVDMGTGMWAAMAVLAALLQRTRDGRGRRLTTALYETTLAWMSYHMTSYWATGSSPGRHGSGASMLVPYRTFVTRDGAELMISTPTDASFARLAAVLGHPEWAEDPRYRHNPERVARRQELDGVVGAAIAARDQAELEDALRAARVPCAPVRDTAGAAEHPQTLALGMIQSIAHPTIEGFRSLGLPILIDGRRLSLRRAPPGLGQHQQEVLEELFINAEEVVGP